MPTLLAYMLLDTAGRTVSFLCAMGETESVAWQKARFFLLYAFRMCGILSHSIIPRQWRGLQMINMDTND